MKTEDLAIFHQVVDSQSFSVVARNRDVPVAQISRRIKALENELGIELFKRTTRQLKTTPNGILLYDRTRSMVSELEQLVDELHDSSDAIRGKIRIQVPSASNDLLPVIRRFQHQHPDVHIDILVFPEELDLIAHGIDVAIRLGPQTDSVQIGRCLGSLNMMVAASPDYLKSHGSPDSPEDLKDHNCLLLRRADGSIENRWQVDHRRDPFPVEGNIIINHHSMILDLLMAGEGIAWLPVIMIGEQVNQGRLVRLFPELEPSDLELWVVYPTKHLQPALLKQFIDYLIENISERLLLKV